MAAFQPSADNTHDLGTSSATWKDLHIKNIISSGETRFNVTDPDDGEYSVASGDHIIMHDNNVILPVPASSNAGRELIIVNKQTGLGQNIRVIPAGDNQAYVAGTVLNDDGEDPGTSVGPTSSIRFISTGSAWYGIAG